MAQLSPQGISNIAWALVTCELLSEVSAYSFLVAAAQEANSKLSSYPPQAISNLCWAIGRLELRSMAAGDAAILSAFVVAAAQEADCRGASFGWQDLSGVAVALSRGKFRVPKVQEVLSRLCFRMAAQLHEVSNHAMLNIAISALRLGADIRATEQVCFAIEQSLPTRAPQLNEADVRQWTEIRQIRDRNRKRSR